MRWRRGAILLAAATLLTNQVVAQTTPRRGPSSTASAPPQEEARRRHARGLVLLDANQPDAAIAELEKALEIRQGGPFEYLEFVPLAQAHMHAGRYTIAIRWFRRRLEVTSIPSRERLRGLHAEHELSRAAIEAQIENLTRMQAFLYIDCNTRARVSVDGHPVGMTLEEVTVDGGARTLQLEAEGYVPHQRVITIAGGQRQRLTLTLQRRGIDGLRPAWFYTVAGVTVATLLAGGVLGSLALARDADVNRMWGVRATEADFVDVRPLAVAADVTLLVGIGGVVASAILAARTDWRSRAGRSPGARALLMPLGDRGSVGLQLVGSF